MPEHVVQPGECVASIAKRYGFFWETLWNLPENSRLKSERKDPNVLLAGDVLHIPELREKEESIAVEARHRFRRKGVPGTFKVRLLHDGEPRADERYVLDIDGELLDGRTDADGWLEVTIPPDAREGRLILPEAGEEYPLQLGHLDPVDTPRGVQQRLKNLGFYGGEIDGEIGSKTRGALLAFQHRQNLEATGEIDDATRQALQDEHQS
jgi:N-acetylmuramoyl-L-alanine amidase